jgi:hypothetical protein
MRSKQFAADSVDKTRAHVNEGDAYDTGPQKIHQPTKEMSSMYTRMTVF